MPEIKNDMDFKAALGRLDAGVQRALGAAFIAPLLTLSDDERITRGVEVARKGAALDEMNAAFKAAKRAIIDSHTRCGAEGNWDEQAGYFIARAAAACLAPETGGLSTPLAWQAAMSCRMARMCQSVDSDADTAEQESARQYKILDDYLKDTKRGLS